MPASYVTLDLTQDVPRSPKEKLCGIVHLPRMIDKVRALKENVLGEYIYPCPLDKIVLNFIKSDEKEFLEKAYNSNEDDMAAWIKERTKQYNASDINFLNFKILDRKPDNKDRLDYFLEIRNNIDSSRTDVITWASLIDLEEGR